MAKHNSKSPIHYFRNRGWFSLRHFKDAVFGRWLGFALAIIGVYVLSSAHIPTQWLGWLITGLSCAIWVWYGYKDKDWPRMLMELFYCFLAIRAILNWMNMI